MLAYCHVSGRFWPFSYMIKGSESDVLIYLVSYFDVVVQLLALSQIAVNPNLHSVCVCTVYLSDIDDTHRVIIITELQTFAVR